MQLFKLSLFFLFFSLSLLQGRIIEAPDLQVIEDQLDMIDSNTLVAFDVDYTLIIPQDQVLKPQASSYLQKFVEETLKKIPKERADYLSSKVLLKSKMSLVNETVLSLIEKIKAKGAKTLGFTAMNTGPYGLIMNMEMWRFKQLQEFGISFSNYFGLLAFHNFEGKDSYPILSNGILCAADFPKGKVLTALLERINFKPSKIIFIDDREDFIESVENEIKHTELLCFHYTESLTLPFEFDEEIASFQLKHLLECEEWLSDEEVKKLLK